MTRPVSQVLKRAATRFVPRRVRSLAYYGAFSIMTEAEQDSVRTSQQMASVEFSLRRLRSLGFRPRRVVDGGAYVGNWTRMIKALFPDAHVLMVEAQPSKRDQLQRICAEFPGDVSCVATLLGPENRGNVTFYELETGSSVLAEKSSIARRAVQYTMRTLDGVIAECAFGHVDMLKLDVQGYELEVLAGASETLKGVDAILMEVSWLRLNEGAPILHEVLAFMYERGFVAYDFCSFIRRPLDNALWQSDIIFLPVASTLLSRQSFD